jgi:hypothetical protein
MRRLLARSLMMAAIAGAVGTPAAAQVSTMDAQRAAAATAFGIRLDALSHVRAATVDGRKKYERACRGKVTTGRSIGIMNVPPDAAWFFEVLALDNETTPACRMLVVEIRTGSQQIDREMERIDEDARRRGIYPGVMRDLKRTYGFE